MGNLTSIIAVVAALTPLWIGLVWDCLLAFTASDRPTFCSWLRILNARWNALPACFSLAVMTYLLTTWDRQLAFIGLLLAALNAHVFFLPWLPASWRDGGTLERLRVAMLHKRYSATCQAPRDGRWRAFEKRLIAERGSCARCGHTNAAELGGHHILPVHEYPHGELDPGNVMVCCFTGPRRCHLQMHPGGWHTYDRDAVKHAAEYLKLVRAAT